MPNDAPTGFWRELAAQDRQAHAREADRALEMENEQLRLRTAELAAALTQAREAILVRHRILADQAVAIGERDRALADLRRDVEQLQTTLHTSRWWRAGEQAHRLARAPRAVLRRVRRA